MEYNPRVKFREHSMGEEVVTRNIEVCRLEFNADEVTGLELRGQQSRAGAAERIEHEVAGAREALNQGRENAERFLRWMQLVAGILPFEHVGNPLPWLRRIALRE